MGEENSSWFVGGRGKRVDDLCNVIESGSRQELVPHYVHDGLLLLPYFEQPQGWAVSPVKAERLYHDSMLDFSSMLAQHYGSDALLLCLGCRLHSDDLHSKFSNNVCEVDASWQLPLGAATCQLHVLFVACVAIHNWLSSSQDHVVVLHVKCTPYGDGPLFLQFLAACYLHFSGEYSSTSAALTALLSLPPAHDVCTPSTMWMPLSSASAMALSCGAIPTQTFESHPLAAPGTAAQRLYCGYFDAAVAVTPLHRGLTLPTQQILKIRSVVLSSCPLISGIASFKPYVKVLQSGQEVRCGLPTQLDSASGFSCGSLWMVPLEVEAEVQGDCALCFHLHSGASSPSPVTDPPFLVFSFHTSFLSPGHIRVPFHQLDCPYPGHVCLPSDFFIDIILQQTSSPSPSPSAAAPSPSLTAEAAAVDGITEASTVGYMCPILEESKGWQEESNGWQEETGMKQQRIADASVLHELLSQKAEGQKPEGDGREVSEGFKDRFQCSKRVEKGAISCQEIEQRGGAEERQDLEERGRCHGKLLVASAIDPKELVERTVPSIGWVQLGGGHEQTGEECQQQVDRGVKDRRSVPCNLEGRAAAINRHQQMRPTAPEGINYGSESYVNIPIPGPPPAPPAPLLSSHRRHQTLSSLSAHLPIPPPPPKSPTPFRAEGAAGREKGVVRAVHWRKVGDVRGTVWEAMRGEGGEMQRTLLREGWQEAILKCFTVERRQQQQQTKPRRDMMGGVGRGDVTLIPLTRANNVAIVLSRFHLSHDAIIHAIRQGDPHDLLSSEKISLLLQILPTAEEIKLLATIQTPPTQLSKPEAFLLHLANIPRLKDKILVLLVLSRFTDSVAEALSMFHLLLAAAQEIRRCHLLRLSMAAALEVGNILNAGTQRGSALGFSFDCLLSLADVKAVSPAAACPQPLPLFQVKNLLEVVVMIVREEVDRARGGMKQQLALTGRAAKLSEVDVSAAIAAIRQSIAMAEKELEALQSEQQMRGGQRGTAEEKQSESEPQDASAVCHWMNRLSTFVQKGREALVTVEDQYSSCRKEMKSLTYFFGFTPDGLKKSDLHLIFQSAWRFAELFDSMWHQLSHGGS